MKTTLRFEYKKFNLDYDFEVTVKCTDRVKSFAYAFVFNVVKRIDVVDLFTISSRRRRTRTILEEKRNAARRDANEIVDDLFEKFLKKNICTSELYINRSDICFIRYDDKHYKIIFTQKEV